MGLKIVWHKSDNCHQSEHFLYISQNISVARKSVLKCFFPFSVLVKGVLPKSSGNFEGTESYPDESPKLQHLQVCLHTKHTMIVLLKNQKNANLS